MQNLTVHPGGPSPFLLEPAYARPRSRAPALPAPADRPAPPVSGTAARHCAAAHPSDISPLSVSSGNARATHVAHERRARAAAGHHPPIGARPHGILAPRGTPTPGPPPFPSSSPLCRAAAERLAPRSCCSTRPPVSTPLRPLLSSAQASPPLPSPEPLPPATGSPLSLVDSGRAPPPFATPR
jgi:hypothetical protein